MAPFYIHHRSQLCSWKCKIWLVAAVLEFHVQEIIFSKAINHDLFFWNKGKTGGKKCLGGKFLRPFDALGSNWWRFNGCYEFEWLTLIQTVSIPWFIGICKLALQPEQGTYVSDFLLFGWEKIPASVCTHTIGLWYWLWPIIMSLGLYHSEKIWYHTRELKNIATPYLPLFHIFLTFFCYFSLIPGLGIGLNMPRGTHANTRLVWGMRAMKHKRSKSVLHLKMWWKWSYLIVNIVT